MPETPIARTLFLSLLIFGIASLACEEDPNDTDPDGGNINDAGPDGGPARSCISCHLSEDALVASLEADPLPEPEEDPESTGEG